MARSLCDLQPELANAPLKRKRLKHEKYSKYSPNSDSSSTGNFPTSKELACRNDKYLNQRCNLGYRAGCILQLARKIENGELEFNKLEESSDTTVYETFYRKLMKIKGFGPFICSNIMMCVGFYKRIPSDSETIRHLKEVHGKAKCTIRSIEKDVEEIYGKYNPFQCMAYWVELVEEYENRFGKLSELDVASYHLVTGRMPKDQ